MDMHATKMKCYINVAIWHWNYGPDFKCFETLLKHYCVTGADFKRFVTFWKRLSSDSVDAYRSSSCCIELCFTEETTQKHKDYSFMVIDFPGYSAVHSVYQMNACMSS